jgi:hypothetical protein
MMSGDILVGAAKSARDALDYWTLGATIAGVVILAIYTTATLWQARLTNAALTETRRSNKATEKSNEIAERSLELGKRAWLVAGLEPVIPAPLTFSHYQIRVTNVGGMPATNVEILCSFDQWESLKPTDEVPDDITPKNNQRLAKGSVIGAGMWHDSIPTGGAGYSGNPTILETCYCKITYLDFFSRPRETVACWQRRQSEIPMEWWIASSKHNYLK